jgi:hypothetical protein
VASYLYETLPTPVVGTFGQTVSLTSILTQEFGSNYANLLFGEQSDTKGYDFYVSYYGAATLKQDDFNYWTHTTTGNANSVTTWLQNDVPIGPTDQQQVPTPAANFMAGIPGTNVVPVTKSNIDQFYLQIGSNIAPLAFISVPVAFDNANKPTEFIQYSIITVDPSLYRPKSAPTADDLVNEIAPSSSSVGWQDFQNKYQNVENNNDCHFIAQDVAAAIGAPLDDPTGSVDPSYNISAGFWSIVPQQGIPIPYWSTLVQPGDIVRYGRKQTLDGKDGGAHTFTVLATTPAGDNIHKLLTVYDNGATLTNGAEGIGVHSDFIPANAVVNSDHYYDDEADQFAVTIYRLASDHKYLIDESKPGFGDSPDLGSRLIGTANDDQITCGLGDDIISSWTGNDLIDGGSGVNALDYSWDNQSISADLWAGTASKGAGNGTDQFVNIQSFIGGSVNDVFYGAAAKCTFDGGKGNNTLDYSSTNNFFHVTVDVTQHTVTKQILGYNGVDNFSNIESFVGTFADDIFRSTVSGSFIFDGDDGLENKLDYSSFQTGITVSLQQASGTVDKGWNVSKGVSIADRFYNIQDFIGGSVDDKFKITPDSIDYTFDGGTGSNTLDYSGFANGVTFDLQQHIVHKGISFVVTGQNKDGIPIQKPVPVTDYFSNIEVFKGGSGDDTLIYGAGTAKPFFDGGAGNNAVVLSGNYSDYDLSVSGYDSDRLWHTVINSITSTDAPLDLVHVQQLRFGDGSTLPLADHGKSYSVSSLFTTSGMVTKYQFWDSTVDPASGHFVVNGVAQAKGQAIDVSASQIPETSFRSGSGSNDLWARTFDGLQWSAWKEFHVSAPTDHAPVIAASDRRVAHGSNAAVSSLFSVSDADGDAMTRYQFWDSTGDPTSGYFVTKRCGAGRQSDHRRERRATSSDPVPERVRLRRPVATRLRRHGMGRMERIPH